MDPSSSIALRQRIEPRSPDEGPLALNLDFVKLASIAPGEPNGGGLHSMFLVLAPGR
jgi:hypothetical protein